MTQARQTSTPPRPPYELSLDLHTRMMSFSLCQSAIRTRTGRIRRGTLSRNRTPIADLVRDRDTVRDELVALLDGMSCEENEALAVMWGNRNWRSGFYEELDPVRDPQP